MTSSETNETCDAILGGAISIIQPRDGYRFSIDSILLARFATIRHRDRVLELGAGSGVVSLAIAALYRPREIIALEMQTELVGMIRRSAALNRIDSIRAVAADLRNPKEEIEQSSFDVIVANPPYRARRTGRISPNSARQLARSEAAASLEDFVAAASRYTRRGGRAALVFAADRSAELIALLRAYALEPKRMRFVHPYVDAPATMVLLEARKNGGTEVAIEPPLILYDARRIYSREAHAMLGEVFSHPSDE